MKRKRSLPSVELSPATVAKLSGLAQAALPVETGGILLGWHHQGNIHVVDAIAVEDPSATESAFWRRHEAGNAALSAYMDDQEAGSPVGYVGEWHSHPGPAGPSLRDKLSFIRITQSAGRPLAQVIIALHGHHWEPIVSISRFTAGFVRRRPR